jgi:hypothetical protein
MVVWVARILGAIISALAKNIGAAHSDSEMTSPR